MVMNVVDGKRDSGGGGQGGRRGTDAGATHDPGGDSQRNTQAQAPEAHAEFIDSPENLPGSGVEPPSPPKQTGDAAPGTIADGSIRFKRWARGDAIDKPMPDGSAPSWDVVRSRYWKNRSEAAASGEFSQANLERMRRGTAPQDYNSRTGQWESRELHHVDPQRNGGSNGPFNLRELTPDQHRALDPYRR
jgi:hypothetical protein